MDTYLKIYLSIRKFRCVPFITIGVGADMPTYSIKGIFGPTTINSKVWLKKNDLWRVYETSIRSYII